MFCPKCACELPDNSCFCRNCGARVEYVPQQEPVAVQQEPVAPQQEPVAAPVVAPQQEPIAPQQEPVVAPVAAPVAPAPKKKQKFCPRCGAEATGLKACPNCGKKLSKAGKVTLLTILFVLLLGVLGASVYFNFDQYYKLRDADSAIDNYEYRLSQVPEDASPALIGVAYEYLNTYAYVANDDSDTYHKSVECADFDCYEDFTVYPTDFSAHNSDRYACFKCCE